MYSLPASPWLSLGVGGCTKQKCLRERTGVGGWGCVGGNKRLIFIQTDTPDCLSGVVRQKLLTGNKKCLGEFWMLQQSKITSVKVKL